jgi:hypothetical protein
VCDRCNNGPLAAGDGRADRGARPDRRQARPELQHAEPAPDVDALLRRIPHVGDKRAQMLVDGYGSNAVLNAIDADPRRAFLRVARLPYRHAADASRWRRQQRRHPSAPDH